MSLSRLYPLLTLTLSLALAGTGHCAFPEAFKWSVQYLIDNSQPVLGHSQEVYPRGNRALAISPDGNFLYLGYNQSFSNHHEYRSRDMRMTDSGEVRKIDLRVGDFTTATKVVLPYHRAKSIAVDAEGRVYLAEGASIEVFDADLGESLLTINTDDCDGVAVAREGNSTVLYASERRQIRLLRYVIEGRMMGGGLKATPAGLKDQGTLDLSDATSLRGLAVDPKGRIWVADHDGNKIYRVNPDGAGLAAMEIAHPMAIAFYGDIALVTKSAERGIALVNEDMVITGNLAVPWEELELAPFGNNRDGQLAGIAIIPGNKGFYVANEHGQTAHQRSTYGRRDANSANVNGRFYMDAFQDDNEPVLRALPVEVEEEATPAPSPEAASSASPEKSGS